MDAWDGRPPCRYWKASPSPCAGDVHSARYPQQPECGLSGSDFRQVEEMTAGN
jgi:hypothetical protein